MRRLTTLEHALLAMLASNAQSGYGLRKQFTSTPMRHFSDSPGSIYPALKRLARRGFVEPVKEARPSRRRRQVFGVTKGGKQELRKWLQRRVTRSDVVWRLDELMLRFAFTAAVFGGRSASHFLRSFRAVLKKYVDELREFVRVNGRSLPLAGRLALEHGLEGYRATLRWTELAEDELEGSRS